MQALLSQEFSGNVRELENIIERSIIFCRTDTLEVKDLLLDNEQETLYPDMDKDMSRISFKEAKDKMILMFHDQYIRSLLRETRGNISKAAEMVGIQRQYLHRLMKKSGIDAANFREKDPDHPSSP
jgi:DNA-binding NtrC family response regulator